jgi:hypothetical protein
VHVVSLHRKLLLATLLRCPFAWLLLQVWTHVVLLVVLPCAAIYSLELSLKAKFLQSEAVAAAATAAGAVAAGASRTRADPGGPLQQHMSGQQQGLPAPSAPVAAAVTHSAGHPQQQHGSRHAGRDHPLAEALAQIEPLRPASFWLPGAGAAVWRCLFLLGLMLGVLMVCWHVSELGILLVLRSGRQLVCDAEGWVRLA